jgi:hypothetical protein
MRRTVAVLAGITISILALAAPAAADDEHSNRCHDYGPSSQDGPNVIYGSLLIDRLIGTNCDDIIAGFRGDDLIVGRGGEDVLWGMNGNDHIRSFDGEHDIVRGGNGRRDRCVVDQLDTYSGCERVRVIEVLP